MRLFQGSIIGNNVAIRDDPGERTSGGDRGEMIGTCAVLIPLSQ